MGSLFSRKKSNKNSVNNFVNVIENRYKHVLTPHEISLLRKYFATAAGGDRVISFPEFVELFGFLNPQCIGPHIVTIAERAFMASDTNFDGYITYDEFVTAYVLSKSRPMAPVPFVPLPPPPPQLLPMLPPPPPMMPQLVPLVPNRPPILINSYFRDNLINLLQIQSNQHKRPGFLNSQESYYYLNWLHTFYGSPSTYPDPQTVARKFNPKKWLSYAAFADFIEPFYRNRSVY